jgi:hypothetical protein
MGLLEKITLDIEKLVRVHDIDYERFPLWHIYCHNMGHIMSDFPRRDLSFERQKGMAIPPKDWKLATHSKVTIDPPSLSSFRSYVFENLPFNLGVNKSSFTSREIQEIQENHIKEILRSKMGLLRVQLISL